MTMESTSPGIPGIPIRPDDVPTVIEKTLRPHPRVAYQGLYQDEASRRKLVPMVPHLVPFRGSTYTDLIALVDWDHRLPSKTLMLRLLAYYDLESAIAGRAALDKRVEEIARQDKFPEFDVPDFEDLPADEAYEIELTPEGELGKARFTSPWRRDLEDEPADKAVALAKGSAEFASILAATTSRPKNLGGLEAVAWAAPCESGHSRWTVDVWYLVQFDGRMGQGRSLLVDIEAGKVITVRDFTVRAGSS
jgi:hypothetical protein